MNEPAAGSPVRRLEDDARMECRICWYVYDPAEGDAEQQVASGTPFSALPGDWHCPQCDGDPGLFLPVEN